MRLDGARQHEPLDVAADPLRSSTSSRWLTRVTSWSMIGPASSSSVT